MLVLAVEGVTPGQVLATVQHGVSVRQVRLELEQHPQGGWHARRGLRKWSPRCHGMNTAILMEAAETFVLPAAPPG